MYSDVSGSMMWNSASPSDVESVFSWSSFPIRPKNTVLGEAIFNNLSFSCEGRGVFGWNPMVCTGCLLRSNRLGLICRKNVNAF